MNLLISYNAQDHHATMLRANLAQEDRKSPVDSRLIMQVRAEEIPTYVESTKFFSFKIVLTFERLFNREFSLSIANFAKSSF